MWFLSCPFHQNSHNLKKKENDEVCRPYLMARNGANCVVKKIRSTQMDFLAFDYFKNANDVAIEIRMRIKNFVELERVMMWVEKDITRKCKALKKACKKQSRTHVRFF